MPNPLDFVFILHNHQPVGNDEAVLEEAYRTCYEPFLGIVEAYPELQFVLHYSGTLLEWLEARHPEFFPRLKALAGSGQVELLGGGYGEPILVMLTDEDRKGQLELLSDTIESRFGVRPRGMWMTERVWEQGLVSGIRGAGLEYTAVDDSHFRRAGLGQVDLSGCFLTEDRGHLLRVFPLDERLRYLIPYGTPEAAIEDLRQRAEGGANRVAVFGDDGEKFGVWPESYRHCYEEGWLRRFFDRVRENSEWLRQTTLAHVADAHAPLGRIYLPDASYREMMIWQLPPEESRAFQALVESSRQGTLGFPDTFLAAGSWRNFRVKYPESNDMYARMMSVSRQVAALRPGSRKQAEAQKALYRGQCNCPYWHGVFGGLYLSHLRAATYRELLSAEWEATVSKFKKGELSVSAEDRDFDGRDEVIALSRVHGVAFRPSGGAHLSEWDHYGMRRNLLAVLSRRPEAYHGHATSDGKRYDGGATGFVYDWYKRGSLIDHFFGPGASLESLAACTFPEAGDYVEQEFGWRRLDSEGGEAAWEFVRNGGVWQGEARVPVRLSRIVRMPADAAELIVTVRIEPGGDGVFESCYGSEWNLAFSEGDAPQRDLFAGPEDAFVSNLGRPQQLPAQSRIRLWDGWLGYSVVFELEDPAAIWTFPVNTLSQSEQGFDENYQGTCVVPHWPVRIEPGGAWETTYRARVVMD